MKRKLYGLYHKLDYVKPSYGTNKDMVVVLSRINFCSIGPVVVLYLYTPQEPFTQLNMLAKTVYPS